MTIEQAAKASDKNPAFLTNPELKDYLKVSDCSQVKQTNKQTKLLTVQFVKKHRTLGFRWWSSDDRRQRRRSESTRQEEIRCNRSKLLIDNFLIILIFFDIFFGYLIDI